ncbi:protein S100-A13 [Mus pahari]|uniref:protein S100-A13 n=1 Tax=Mus pahari TaxID=10093 RepID=UPI0011149FFE|nr:protein S100-A13 [Mus pahari]
MVPPDQAVSQSRGAVGWLLTVGAAVGMVIDSRGGCVGMVIDSRGGPLSGISGGGNLTLRTWEWLSPCLVLKNFSRRAPDLLAASHLLSRSICVDISSFFGILMAAEHLSKLEVAIDTVINTFFNFANGKGRKDSLTINEFKELATQQLPHLLKNMGSLDEKMKTLVVNQDSELQFNAYWKLIGELAQEISKEKALKK